MKFWEALREMRENGKKIKRKDWNLLFSPGDFDYKQLDYESIVATDWEVVEEKPKTVKRWGYAYKTVNTNIWIMSMALCTDEEAKEEFKDTLVYKIPGTEVEIPE